MINSYLTCSEELDDRAIHLLFSANRYCVNHFFSSNVQVLISTSLICLSAEQSVELSAQVGEGEADSEEIGGGDEHHH